MNRIKRVALSMVVMAGMTLAMGSVALAQQEAMPDEFKSADEMSVTQPIAQQKDKDKGNAQVAKAQPKARHHKQVAKQNASGTQTVALVRKQ